jgi:hypothetical protein
LQSPIAGVKFNKYDLLKSEKGIFMKLLILLGLLVSSSSFAERVVVCPGSYSDAKCKEQCSGSSRSYNSENRECTIFTNYLRDYRGKKGQPSAKPAKQLPSKAPLSE